MTFNSTPGAVPTQPRPVGAGKPAEPSAGAETHKCSRCGLIKPVGEFYRDPRNASGRRYECKACTYTPRPPRPKVSADERRIRANERRRARRTETRAQQQPQPVKAKAEKKPRPVKVVKPPKPAPPVLVLEPVLERNIAAFLNAKASKRASTALWYERILRSYAQHLVENDLEQWPADAETFADNINSFLAGRLRAGNKPGGVNGYWRGLRCWLRWLAARDRVPAAVLELAESVRSPKPLPKAIPEESAGRLMSCLEEASGASWQNCRDYALITLALDCGIRIGELAGLTFEMLDLKHRTITVSWETVKDGESRSIVFSQAAADPLARWLEVRAGLSLPDDLTAVFVGKQPGRPFGALTDSGMRQAFAGWQQRAGIGRYTFHQLRHSYAVYSIRAGQPLNDLQQQLGHSNISTTARYLLVSDVGRASRHEQHNPLAYLLAAAREAAEIAA